MLGARPLPCRTPLYRLLEWQHGRAAQPVRHGSNSWAQLEEETGTRGAFGHPAPANRGVVGAIRWRPPQMGFARMGRRFMARVELAAARKGRQAGKSPAARDRSIDAGDRQAVPLEKSACDAHGLCSHRPGAAMPSGRQARTVPAAESAHGRHGACPRPLLNVGNSSRIGLLASTPLSAGTADIGQIEIADACHVVFA